MALLQKIKDFFRIGQTSTDDNESTKNQRLSEYLAQENERRKKWEERRYQELHSQPQEKMECDEPVTHQNNNSLCHEERRNLTEFRAEEERLKLEEERIAEIQSEEERVRAEEQRKLAKIQAEQERLKLEEQRLEEIRAEEERIKAEERRRLAEIQAEERRIKEIEWLRKINVLSRSNSDHREYLIECQSFRREFGKNVHCDVCGKSEEVNFELFVVRQQTYCKSHVPPDYHRELERKKIAGRHGSSRDYIEK